MSLTTHTQTHTHPPHAQGSTRWSRWVCRIASWRTTSIAGSTSQKVRTSSQTSSAHPLFTLSAHRRLTPGRRGAQRDPPRVRGPRRVPPGALCRRRYATGPVQRHLRVRAQVSTPSHALRITHRGAGLTRAQDLPGAPPRGDELLGDRRVRDCRVRHRARCARGQRGVRLHDGLRSVSRLPFPLCVCGHPRLIAASMIASAVPLMRSHPKPFKCAITPRAATLTALIEQARSELRAGA